MAAADEDDITGLHDMSSEDDDYSYDDDVSDNDTSLQSGLAGRRGPYSKKKQRSNFIMYCCCMVNVVHLFTFLINFH